MFMSRIMNYGRRTSRVSRWALAVAAVVLLSGLLLMGLRESKPVSAQSTSVTVTVAQRERPDTGAIGFLKNDRVKITVNDLSLLPTSPKFSFAALTNTNKPDCASVRGYSTDQALNNDAFTSFQGGAPFNVSDDARWLCVRIKDKNDVYAYGVNATALDFSAPEVEVEQLESTQTHYVFRVDFKNLDSTVNRSEIHYALKVTNFTPAHCGGNDPVTVVTGFPTGWGNASAQWTSATSGSVSIAKELFAGNSPTYGSGPNDLVFCVLARDKSGNKAMYAFTGNLVDRTNPAVTIVDQGPRVNVTVVDKLVSEDPAAGKVASISHTYTDSATTVCKDATYLESKTTTYSNPKATQVKSWQPNLDGGTSTKAYICVKAVDAFGNVGYFDKDGDPTQSRPFNATTPIQKTIYVGIAQEGGDTQSPKLTATYAGYGGTGHTVTWKSGYVEASGTCTADGVGDSLTADSATGLVNKVDLATRTAPTSTQKYFCFSAALAGTNTTEYAAINIEDVDYDGPVVAPLTQDGDDVTATATDAGSGVDKDSWRYVVTSAHCPSTSSTTAGWAKPGKADDKKATITLDARSNNKRVCVFVKDELGNISTTVGHIFTSNTKPSLKVTQSGNALTFSSTDQLAYSRQEGTTKPDCSQVAATDYTTGQPTLTEADNGKYICFKSFAEPVYVAFMVSGVDKTAPVISLTQAGTQIVATANEAVTWKYFKTTDSTAPTNCDTTYDWKGTGAGTGTTAELVEADAGKHICFQATDKAGNMTYKSQQITAVDTSTDADDAADDTTDKKDGEDTDDGATTPATDDDSDTKKGDDTTGTDDDQTTTPTTPVAPTVTITRDGDRINAVVEGRTIASWNWYWTNYDYDCDDTHKHFAPYLADTKGYTPQPGTTNSTNVANDDTDRYYCFRAVDSAGVVHYGEYFHEKDGETVTTPTTTPSDDTPKTTEPATTPAEDPTTTTDPATTPADGADTGTTTGGDADAGTTAGTDDEDGEKDEEKGEDGATEGSNRNIWIIAGVLAIAVILVIVISSQGSRNARRE